MNVPKEIEQFEKAWKDIIAEKLDIKMEHECISVLVIDLRLRMGKADITEEETQELRYMVLEHIRDWRKINNK